MSRITIVAVMLAACGYPDLPSLSGSSDAHVGDGKVSDGKELDAFPMGLAVSASPKSFTVHPNDVRETLITVANGTTQMDTPTLAVSGLAIGSMTFTSNTCVNGVSPGQTCTAIGHLTATTAGQVDFQITASTTSLGTAMTPLSLTVRAACGANCGGGGMALDCCTSSVVGGNAVGATNAGDTFFRGYDVAGDGVYGSVAYPATVSDFRLDTYLVSVGRFRTFVNAGYGTQVHPPNPGDGARKLNGLSAQGGWDSSYDTKLAADTASLMTQLKCNATSQTWTDAVVSSSEGKPINCVTWEEAMAFCLWDGGFLPTEAEWQYAASGGHQQRAYAWSNPAGSLSVDCSYTNYQATPPCVGGVNQAGSESPKGDGRWNQTDLGGNVLQWVLDYQSSYGSTCDDCAALDPSTGGRVTRGGRFDYPPQRANVRSSAGPEYRSPALGIRCARFK